MALNGFGKYSYPGYSEQFADLVGRGHHLNVDLQMYLKYNLVGSCKWDTLYMVWQY